MGPPGVSHTFVQTLDLCHTTVKQLMRNRYTQAVPNGPGDILELIRHGRATTRGDVLELTGLVEVSDPGFAGRGLRVAGEMAALSFEAGDMSRDVALDVTPMRTEVHGAVEVRFSMSEVSMSQPDQEVFRG